MRMKFLSGVCLLLCLSTAMRGGAAERDLRLIQAVRRADEPAVRALLKQGVDINARAGDGATALHWAAYQDNLALTDLLIRTGAAVDAANDLGVTPLWIASRNANVAILTRLLDAGAHPDVAPPGDGTPLMVAARRGSTEGVKILLAHGANVNAKEAAHGQTALMWAIAEGQPNVVRLLIELGADVQARSATVRRHVMLCCQSYEGDTEGAADIDEGGFTPFLFAAQRGDIEAATMLLSAGAHVNDRAAMGTSALVVAVYGGHSTFAAFLLDHGADANDSQAGYTALHLAAARGDLDLMKALLAHGANPNARQTKPSPTNRVHSNHALDKTTIGATPFLVATRVAELDAMRLLAASGSDVTLPVDNGTTALMVVQAPVTTQGARRPESRTVEAMKLAIQLGVPVNGANRDGDTALHVAATRRFDAAVQLLAESGAALNAKNNNGETPLAAALKPPPPGHGAGLAVTTEHDRLLNHIETAALLRKLGAKE